MNREQILSAAKALEQGVETTYTTDHVLTDDEFYSMWYELEADGTRIYILWRSSENDPLEIVVAREV